MSQKEVGFDLGEEFYKAKIVLEKILAHIQSLDSYLRPLEQNLREKEFTSRGAFVKRNPSIIFCIPTSSSYSFETISKILEKAPLEPSLIWIDDYTESEYSCQQIAMLIDTQFLKLIEKKIAIINLKSSLMIQPFERQPTMMIGKRYSHNDESILKLVVKLKQIGIQVFQDYREFGGGPLVSTLIKTLHLPKDSLVVELTMSQAAVKEVSCVNAIVEFFASEWM